MHLKQAIEAYDKAKRLEVRCVELVTLVSVHRFPCIDELLLFQVPKGLSPHGLRFNGSNWAELLGKRQYYRDLVRVFSEEIQAAATAGEAKLSELCATLTPGEANKAKRAAPPKFGWVMVQHLPTLMSGAAGAYFHGLVSAAVATSSASNGAYENTNALAEALAYLVYRCVEVVSVRMTIIVPPCCCGCDVMVVLIVYTVTLHHCFCSNEPLGPLHWPPSAEVLAEFHQANALSAPAAGDAAGINRSVSPVLPSSPTAGAARAAGKRGTMYSPLKPGPPPKTASSVGVPGSRSLLEVVAAVAKDKRFAKLFNTHEGKFKHFKWSSPRSFHVGGTGV